VSSTELSVVEPPTGVVARAALPNCEVWGKHRPWAMHGNAMDENTALESKQARARRCRGEGHDFKLCGTAGSRGFCLSRLHCGIAVSHSRDGAQQGVASSLIHACSRGVSSRVNAPSLAIVALGACCAQRRLGQCRKRVSSAQNHRQQRFLKAQDTKTSSMRSKENETRRS